MSDLNKILIKFQEFQLEMNLLKTSFKNVSEAAESFKALAQQFLDLDKSIEEQPILIGYLNKAQGFNGFKKSEVGTEVFSYKDKYFINIESLDGQLNRMVNYYKETLKSVIDFIETKD